MRDDSIPKLCECGCGEVAPIATLTNRKWGHVKGEPMRFVNGHNVRHRKLSDAEKVKLVERWRSAGNPRWSDGRYVDGRGYTVIVLADDHAFASMRDGRNRVYQHRLVMAEHLRRPLLGSEEIHHIDLDKANDAIHNLIIVSGREHKRIHALIRHGTGPAEATQRVLAERSK